MKKMGRGNKQKMTFLMTRMIKNVKIKKKVILNVDETETMPYASPKRENDMDDNETIVYASPKRESGDEIDKKIYTETSLKLPLRLKNKL